MTAQARIIARWPEMMVQRDAACIADDMDDWDDEPASDPDQVFLDFVCGMLPNGQCMLAGSEDCDWECPYGGMN